MILYSVDVLFHAFRKPGYTVTHENNGKRADHLLAAHEFDVVILDMGLPDMDGADILRRLRHRKNNVPVLILTARDDVQDRVHGLDMGADDYLTKPFDIHELEARVRSLIRRGHSGQWSAIAGRFALPGYGWSPGYLEWKNAGIVGA